MAPLAFVGMGMAAALRRLPAQLRRGRLTPRATAVSTTPGAVVAQRSRPLAERGFELTGAGTVMRRGRDLAQLTESLGSPLHIVEPDVISANARAAVGAATFSTVASSYKTNPVPAVLAELHANGVQAEVISPFEWWLALRMGVGADQIIYNGPAKSRDSLIDAARRGAFLVNINSVPDVDHMADAAREAGRPLRAGVRISLPHMWGGQFGVDGQSSAVTDTVRNAVASPWLDLMGLHAHSGFPLASAGDVEQHVVAVLDTIDRLREATGWTPDVLDLGGSAQCSTLYRPGSVEVIRLAEVIELCEQLVDAHATKRGWPRPRLVFEPGKALTANTQFTLTTVVAVVDGPDDELVATIDVGRGLVEPMRSEHHDIYNLSRPDAPMRATRLRGPDAVGDDWLGDPVLLAEVAVGDVLAMLDTGAYFVPFSRAASTLRAAIATLDAATGDVAIVRRREDAAHVHRLDSSAISE